MKNYWKFIKESQDHKEIKDICKRYSIGDYTVNEDGTVDVDGDVDLKHWNYTLYILPIKFGTVTGNFSCGSGNDIDYKNELTSLEGCPHTVGGDFRCPMNNLTSLEGGPTEVGGNYYCYKNKLSSLKGAPSSVYGIFHCGNNKLTSLEGGPTEVGGRFNCTNNKLTSFKGGPKSFSGHLFNFKTNKITSFEGFPEIHRDKVFLNASFNPVKEVYKLFNNNVQAIRYLNEWEVIDVENMEVSYLRLSEVYNDLDMEVPPREDITFKKYTLVG